MTKKEPRQSKISREQPNRSEKRDRREIADDELESVSGGLGSATGVGISDTSVCISQL